MHVYGSVFNGNAWSAHRSQFQQSFPFTASTNFFQSLCCTLSRLYTIYSSTKVTTFGNFHDRTVFIVDCCLPPVDFVFLSATAVCNEYTAVVRHSSGCLPFPFALLNRRCWAPKPNCGRAVRWQLAASQVPSWIDFCALGWSAREAARPSTILFGHLIDHGVECEVVEREFVRHRGGCTGH